MPSGVQTGHIPDRDQESENTYVRAAVYASIVRRGTVIIRMI